MTFSRKLSLVLLLPLALPACGASSVENDFLCPVVDGIQPCSTIAEADGASAGGTTPVREAGSDTLGKELSQEPLGLGKGSKGPLRAMGDGGMPYAAVRYRVPEQVGTLWIAPYQDGDGILHEATFVHFVVSEPHWASGVPR